MALSREDKSDVKHAFGSSAAKKIDSATKDSSVRGHVLDLRKSHTPRQEAKKSSHVLDLSGGKSTPQQKALDLRGKGSTSPNRSDSDRKSSLARILAGKAKSMGSILSKSRMKSLARGRALQEKK